MKFVAEAFGSWLLGQFADAGRKWLATSVLGNAQERALQRAAAAAIQQTAGELRPEATEHAAHLAMVIDQVFSEPFTSQPMSEHSTLLEALQEGISEQLAVLDDSELAGIGQSSAEMLDVPIDELAGKLTIHLLHEIMSRGARGEPLAPLANQLNHELTRLQGRHVEHMLKQLADEFTRLESQIATPP